MKDSSEYQTYKDVAGQFRGFDLNKLSSVPQKKAFWINLYNTIIVHGIIELSITSTVREISNFFSHIAYRIGDFIFSAEEIEHGILRVNTRPPYRIFPLFKRNDPRREFSLDSMDPRIHFALVCGSRSCAPIRFYEADLIDDQLEIAAINFINSSEVLILPEKNKIFLSQIFNWYERDFGGKRKIFLYLLKYLQENEKSEFLRKNMDTIHIEYLFYDWNLNH